jgi:hypothetical protein
MPTDKEIMKAFQEQFNTGGLFTESQVLVLMGYARGDERRKITGENEAKENPPYKCPYTRKSCPYVDTSGPGKTRECYDCENME